MTLPSLWLALACYEPEPGDPAQHPDAPVARVDQDHPTVVHVTWSTEQPVTGRVEFGLDGELDRTSPPVGPTREHQHQLLALKVGRTYSWRTVVQTDDGEVVGPTGTITVPDAPSELPRLALSVDEEASSLDGKYLLTVGATSADALESPLARYYVLMLDADGDVVWYHLLPEGSGTSGALPWSDGSSLWWMEYDNTRQEPDALIRRIRLDGAELATTFAPTGHHAADALDDHRIAHLGRTFVPGERGETHSIDRVLIVEEGDLTGAGAIELFDYYTDWWQGDLGYYWLEPCALAYPDTFGFEVLCDLTHSNSLAYVEEDDAIYVYPRFLDALLKIDATTGELRWMLGGPRSEFTYPDGSPVHDDRPLWSAGHFSQVWSGGLVMFDNGLFRDPQVSSLVEVAWDEEARTVEEVFRFADPAGGFTPSLGDVKKLESGHYLASWMSLSKINEVTPEREIVWQLDATDGTAFRRVHVVEDPYDLARSADPR